MQPEGPFQFVTTLGLCQVGRVWSAVDGNGRQLTVAVLDPAAAVDQRWREAFASMANALAQPTANGPRYVLADFVAPAPWVAYATDGGPGAERLFQALGMDYQPMAPDRPQTDAATQVLPIVEPSPADATTVLPAPTGAGSDESTVHIGPKGSVGQGETPPQPVSVPPLPASTPPQPTAEPVPPVSAPPQPPWAAEPLPIPSQPVSGPPDLPWAAEPMPVQQESVSEAPQSPAGPTPADLPAPQHDPFASPIRRIVPSEPPARRTGLWIGVSALVLLLVAVGGGIAWAALSGGGTRRESTAPPYTLEERALAIASPSLVYVEAIITGYLRDKSTNDLLRTTPIIFNRRCSGFVVTPDGHVLTNTHCIKPDDGNMRRVALEVLGRILIREQKLDSEKFSEYVKSNLDKTLFTGADPISEPESQLYGQLNLAKGNLTEEPAIPGEIVKTLHADEGNIAVIKLAQESLPVAALSESPILEPGASLLAVGYHTSDADFNTASYTQRSKSVTVTRVGQRGSVSILHLDDEAGSNAQGGVVLDTSGRVVGMLDSDQSRPDRANQAMVPLPTIMKLLDEAGVKNTFGPSDELYRSGLDAYFAGRYSAAISQLDMVVEQSPANATAETYRQKALDRQKIEEGSSGLPVWMTSLLAGIGGALIVGVIMVLWSHVRRRPALPQST